MKKNHEQKGSIVTLLKIMEVYYKQYDQKSYEKCLKLANKFYAKYCSRKDYFLARASLNCDYLKFADSFDEEKEGISIKKKKKRMLK